MMGRVRKTSTVTRYDPVISDIQPNGNGPTAAEAIVPVAAALRMLPIRRLPK